jgi:hypothetical protein
VKKHVHYLQKKYNMTFLSPYLGPAWHPLLVEEQAGNGTEQGIQHGVPRIPADLWRGPLLAWEIH